MKAQSMRWLLPLMLTVAPLSQAMTVSPSPTPVFSQTGVSISTSGQSFDVTLPATDYVLTLSDLKSPVNYFTELGANVVKTGTADLLTQILFYNGNPAQESAQFSADAGDYTVSVFGTTNPPNGGIGTWSLQLTPVPGPTSWILFLSGLALVSYLAFRKPTVNQSVATPA